jgi:hypothetical protein
MRILLQGAIAVAFVGVMLPVNQSRADIVEEALGCVGNPCVVDNSTGGNVSTFRSAARQVKRTGRKVVIDGPCYSACAIFADMARSNVCVTPKGSFGFHQGEVVGIRENGDELLLRRYTPEHSSDIAGWVNRNGGFPTQGFRVMSASAAGKYWKRC